MSKHPHFRKATKKDLKVGQLYIVRYSSYDTDLRCARANMSMGIHMFAEIKYIEGNRIVFGPKGSTGAFSGLNITSALIPTEQSIIDDWKLWDKLLKEEQNKRPLDYGRGVSADQEVDWSYDMDARAYKRFRKLKNEQLGKTDLKLKDLSEGDKFMCTGELTNHMGDLFFEVGQEYAVDKVKKSTVEMKRSYAEAGIGIDIDMEGNIELRMDSINDQFTRL